MVVDLAYQHMGAVFTAIPLYFSDRQISHLIATAKPDIVLSDKKSNINANKMGFTKANREPILQLHLYQRVVNKIGQSAAVIPANTSKITYTSGSTGQPKGVCLSLQNQLNVAQSLVAVSALKKPKHLCLLPLSTLLENIAGIYSPLLAGGTVYLANNQQRGFSGSRLSSPSRQLLACITSAQSNSLILVPELLQVLLQGCVQGWKMPSSLEFIALGGSKVSQSLLDSARQLGLPVFQGYGLSECASVVSLATPQCSVTGCAGKLLPHLSAKVIDKQLVVYGNSFLGYLNEPDTWAQECVYTGDIAQICNGEVVIKGRQKNLIISSFARNISPEWVEAELFATGLFQQAVLLGDSKPYCIALLRPLCAQIDEQQLAAAIDRVNQGLPDYAQVKKFICLNKALSFENGLLTANGRPKRQAISTYYQNEINRLYLQ